jgi:hypothetical protein
MQPFVQLGARLQRDGHRVRLATHACFRDFVVGKGLEFYPLAGDPLKLSEFMVKTQGFVIPTTPELLMEVKIALFGAYACLQLPDNLCSTVSCRLPFLAYLRPAPTLFIFSPRV